MPFYCLPLLRKSVEVVLDERGDYRKILVEIRLPNAARPFIQIISFVMTLRNGPNTEVEMSAVKVR